MSFTRKTKLFAAGISLIFILSINIFSQNKKNEQATNLLEPLPRGNWSIVYHPYLNFDQLNSPVIVQSVSTKRLTVEKFEIQNISSKAVKAVKVRWIICENQDQSKILQQGQTRLLNFRNELAAGVMGFVKLRVVSFADFYRSFLTDGQLNKSLDISLMIDEVTFADGTVWKWEDGISPDINPKFTSNTAALGDCAKQACVGRPSSTVKDAVVYSCGSSQSNERCVPNGDFDCTNQSCTRPTGGGGDHEIILN